MEDLAQPELSDNLIEQFGRQILVPGIDEQGQLNLSKRKVCIIGLGALGTCLLYTSPSPRDRQKSRMPSSA